MTALVGCKHCELERRDLASAITRANRDVLRDGTADTSKIKQLKAEIARCKACGGTGRVEGVERSRPYRRDATPTPQVKAKPQKPAVAVDPAEIAAALEEAAAKTRQLRHSSAARPQVTGYCHDCQKQIVWGRLYCGRCFAERSDTGRQAAS